MGLVQRLFGERPASDPANDDSTRLGRALAAAGRDDDGEPVTIAPLSLDDLESQIHRARNRVVHCQAELGRAEMELDDALQTFSEECTRRRLLHR